ncbi:uncharacterized protein LOC141651316 [Silene latifolia]|uniref:uncharacterized protein LOC141651316 n=1 Tax=Silene latifolia TaxID=37657 RepID=UPI003D787B7F
MAPGKSKFHPAFAVTNISNHISVKLGLENDQYPLWVALFRNHAKSNRVLHHIITPKFGAPKAPVTDDEKEQWETLDATFLQWIYSTITTDLLETVIESDSTAMDTWNRIADIFQDNKNSRAVTLEQEFSHVEMSDFSSASAYCQRLKSLADQLKNVGAPVTNSRLVLQLVSGLTEAYQNVGSIIRQRDPLPQFYQARSMLTLEEASFAKQAATGSAAMYVKGSADSDGGSSSSPNSGSNTGKGNRGNGNNKKKGKGSKGKSQTPASAPITAPESSPVTAPSAPHQWPAGYGSWQWPSSPWGYPPCRYPTSPWARPSVPSRAQSGILGPRPARAYAAEGPSQTDIDAAMYTLGLGPPDPWVMDTGATSYMTSDLGKLSSFVNSSIPNGIIVGNGHSIPVKGYGQSTILEPHPPSVLKNVLYSPQLVKNLVLVRKFTTDNQVTIEFNPFGFCIKDMRTGTRLMRCNSRGNLYPISGTNTSQLSPNFVGLAASSLWHDRLVHPGNATMSCLRSNKLIDCNLKSSKLNCQSCPLGKHIRLPFAMSNSSTYMPFYILHCDLWTSPVLSSAGHKYYSLWLLIFFPFL